MATIRQHLSWVFSDQAVHGSFPVAALGRALLSLKRKREAENGTQKWRLSSYVGW